MTPWTRTLVVALAAASLLLVGCTNEHIHHQAPGPGPAPIDPGPAPVDPGPAPVDPGPGPGPGAVPPPDWANRTIRATGMGAPRPGQPMAQGRLTAMRAARMDAMRKLSEEINGLMLTSRTSVRDFVTENDEIRSKTSAYIRGAREISARNLEDGSAEVVVEITGSGIYEIIKPHLRP